MNYLFEYLEKHYSISIIPMARSFPLHFSEMKVHIFRKTLHCLVKTVAEIITRIEEGDQLS